MVTAPASGAGDCGFESRRGYFLRRRFLRMIEVVVNDRLGTKARVKCEYALFIFLSRLDDTIGDLKKLIAAQTGVRAEKDCPQKVVHHL